MTEMQYGVIVLSGDGRCVFASAVLDTRAEAEALQARMGEGVVVNAATLRWAKRQALEGTR
jgi:hypothetical protein